MLETCSVLQQAGLRNLQVALSWNHVVHSHVYLLHSSGASSGDKPTDKEVEQWLDATYGAVFQHVRAYPIWTLRRQDAPIKEHRSIGQHFALAGRTLTINAVLYWLASVYHQMHQAKTDLLDLQRTLMGLLAIAAPGVGKWQGVAGIPVCL